MIHAPAHMSDSATDVMSSASFSASPVDEEVPRMNGSRGGKRSVSHLSKAQLARKRANDREAQRNIRQRTKEHIEALENKVKELEEYQRSGSIDRIVQRNKELEAEVKRLRSQIATSTSPIVEAPVATVATELSSDLLVPQKVQYFPEDASCSWSSAVGPRIPALESPSKIPVASGNYTSSTSHPQLYRSTSMGHEAEDVSSPPWYGPTAIPIWEDPMVFGDSTQAASQQPTPEWAPFHPAFNQPSRFADLQPSGFSDLLNQPTYTTTTCWQKQPSIYAWQISTKLKAPVTFVDQLMISVINSQRHLAIHGDISSEELIGSSFPSVHQLFNQPGPAKPPSTLTEVMSRYSAVLSNRGFALIPEKLASFMCMYRFVQWQISPTFDTFKKLHDWQAPRPSQLLVPHPAWMDLPPWGKFREKVIEDQTRYDNIEFQNDYATNLCVNFPYDPMKALIFEDGKIMISPLLDKHLSDISNMSMRKAFADKYPEFREVCRCE